MFEDLVTRTSALARHRDAPYAEERARYLAHCAHRGDSRATLLLKARTLIWVAQTLRGSPPLSVTIDQLRAVAGRGRGRERDPRWAQRRFVDVARPWLRFLGGLRERAAAIPFQAHLEDYDHWAEHDRGLTAMTIARRHGSLKQFLCWYGRRARPLSEVQPTDIDAYLAEGQARGWGRCSVRHAAMTLRAFFRYGAMRGWSRPHLAEAIHSPRLYALESLPASLEWVDVQRLLVAVDTARPRDVRDRAILMLLALYGLRASEVAALRLDYVDWDGDRLHVARAKRRDTQVYPLLPSVGNALLRYLHTTRRPSPHREIFLTLTSPFRPLSRGALYSVVCSRLKALEIPAAHRGPHALRHACAARLVTEGFSLKEIGDHLGHRSSAATRIYAKVDLPHLRAVAAFDLGGLP
jgi:site-specific recombinase XerD